MLQATDKKKVAKAISELGRRVTAADVSTKTGLPLLVVSQALNQIASDTHGRIAVSQRGDLVYSFHLGFANTYLTYGIARFIEKAVEQIVKVGTFLVKISFGVMLMISFFIVVFLFCILFYSQKGQSRSRKRRAGSGAAENSLMEPLTGHASVILLRDAFIALMHKPPVKYDYRYPTVRRREKSNFLLDCFSLLFGDGDPNEGLSEKRWQLIAKVIKQHDNVVTAEQLAPYTGADPKDEDAVLPVLVRFNGKPEVTESGNIIYTFPSLAATAGSDQNDKAPSYLTEFPLKFTEVDHAALVPIYSVATINFMGSWFLYFLLAHKNAPSISALLAGLVAYATMFVMIPVLRYWSMVFINNRIDRRNADREESADALIAPEHELKKKISESREYRLRNQRIGSGSIVYTTDKNTLDQEDALSLSFKPGDVIDAQPEETFDAKPGD